MYINRGFQFHFNISLFSDSYDELLRDSDRLKNQRIQIEERMKLVDDETSALMADKQKINDKVRSFEVCNENLKRHVQKMSRMSPTIGELIAFNQFEYILVAFKIPFFVHLFSPIFSLDLTHKPNRSSFCIANTDLRIEKERVKAENQAIVKHILTLNRQKSEAFQQCTQYRDAEQKERDLFEIFMQANAELSNVAQQIRVDVDKAKVGRWMQNRKQLIFVTKTIFHRNWWTRSRRFSSATKNCARKSNPRRSV